MKHAILLTVHDNVPVVKTLMQMLDDDRFTFYLLIDKKSGYVSSDYIPELDHAKVRVIPQITMNWGAYSLIEGEFILIETALKDKVDYLHYLQGADLPLKDADAIDAFFSKGGIFVDVNPEPSDFACYKVLCKHFFTECRHFRTNRFLKILNHACAHAYKPFMKTQKLYGKLYTGSALWSIPSKFAEYVLEHRAKIKKVYKRSLAADEVYIQSLLMNSDYRNERSIHGNARLIDWKHAEGNSPKTFTMNDAQELSDAVADPSIMFMRKVHVNRDAEVVTYIRSIVASGV